MIKGQRIKGSLRAAFNVLRPVCVDVKRLCVILSHFAVSEAISFPLPDAKYGESVNAAIVLSEPVSESSIIEFCTDKLAPFKVPGRIFILDELPKSATGKIQRRSVAEMFKD